MLEAGILGVPWHSTRAEVEAIHPGGAWRRKTEAHVPYFIYSLKSSGSVFGLERVAHLPTAFMFENEAVLTGFTCWLQTPIDQVEQAFALLQDGCGPFDANDCRQGDYWRQFLRPGFVVLAQKGTVTAKRQRLNLVVGYHRSGPMAH
ncbi:hypothetical protein MCEMSHM24_01188 [Comamonadaceae bacterium]